MASYHLLCPATPPVNNPLQFECKLFWMICVLRLLLLFLIEEQAKSLDPYSPLQPLNGELLPLHAVLRPLRLLPLSPVQHYLQLLENELPVPEEDIEVTQIHARLHTHMHQLRCATCNQNLPEF